MPILSQTHALLKEPCFTGPGWKLKAELQAISQCSNASLAVRTAQVLLVDSSPMFIYSNSILLILECWDLTEVNILLSWWSTGILKAHRFTAPFCKELTSHSLWKNTQHSRKWFKELQELLGGISVLPWPAARPRELLLLIANSSGTSTFCLCAGHPSRETLALLLGFDLKWEKTRGELVEEVTFRTEGSEQKQKLPTVTYGTFHLVGSPSWSLQMLCHASLSRLWPLGGG